MTEYKNSENQQLIFKKGKSWSVEFRVGVLEFVECDKIRGN